jgi:hypothetical protein
MPKKLKSPDKFRFMTEKSIREEKFQLTRWQSAQLRAKLPRAIYWHQLEKGGLIHWNWDLVCDFLIQGDCPSHQELVSEYIATLPQVN